MKTLWVANTAEGRKDGSLVPIDPKTGKPGEAIPVEDPYNMYFAPDGKSAIVVAEAYKRLDFRDPHTFQLQYQIPVPQCAGVNHADFSIDGSYALFTCEFAGSLVKIDLVNRKVAGYLRLKKGRMPQDIRISPDGKLFYVADMKADGLFIIDGDALKEVGFLPTGVGAHGLYPSRDGKKLYVANRGSNVIRGKPKGPGSVSVLDFATGKVEANWPLPGGGSPDMGNVSADGRWLWLSAISPRRVRDRHDDGCDHQHPGWEGTARAHRVATAMSLFVGPYRQHAMTQATVSQLIAPARRRHDQCINQRLLSLALAHNRRRSRGPRATCITNLTLNPLQGLQSGRHGHGAGPGPWGGGQRASMPQARRSF